MNNGLHSTVTLSRQGSCHDILYDILSVTNHANGGFSLQCWVLIPPSGGSRPHCWGLHTPGMLLSSGVFPPFLGGFAYTWGLHPPLLGAAHHMARPVPARGGGYYPQCQEPCRGTRRVGIFSPRLQNTHEAFPSRLGRSVSSHYVRSTSLSKLIGKTVRPRKRNRQEPRK